MEKYTHCFTNRRFLATFFFSLIFLLLALFINFHAGTYATESQSNSVTDIVLSNTRVYDLDAVFIYGAILFWVFVIGVTLYDPKRAPFTYNSVALFVLVRSLFISLTHLGPFPDRLILPASDIISKFSFGGDLFFSGHTGLPFLMALVFWDIKPLRYLFIFSAILFGIVVLLAHLHYSIDVLAAFFITYTIYHISEFLFKKDREMFFSGV